MKWAVVEYSASSVCIIVGSLLLKTC